MQFEKRRFDCRTIETQSIILAFFYPLFSFSFSFYFYLALWIWLNLNAQSQHDDTEVNDMSVHAQTELN